MNKSSSIFDFRYTDLKKCNILLFTFIDLFTPMIERYDSKSLFIELFTFQNVLYVK